MREFAAPVRIDVRPRHHRARAGSTNGSFIDGKRLSGTGQPAAVDPKSHAQRTPMQPAHMFCGLAARSWDPVADVAPYQRDGFVREQQRRLGRGTVLQRVHAARRCWPGRVRMCF